MRILFERSPFLNMYDVPTVKCNSGLGAMVDMNFKHVVGEILDGRINYRTRDFIDGLP